jgi:hypothetical protein
MELSTAALRRMQRELDADAKGVVDEVGVLAVHAGYADRFFPGTSVLQTRARYIFFTCWNYLWLRQLRSLRGRSAVLAKDRCERWVTKQLGRRQPRSRGIIGIQVYPRSPVQTPDFIYWTALQKFGLYRGLGRTTLLAQWDSGRIGHVTDRRDDEEHESPEDDMLARFSILPMPAYWQRRMARPLDFRLTRAEADFLKAGLVSLGPTCVLARAAGMVHQVKPTGDRPWHDPLVRHAAVAAEQTDTLERARLASSLARLVRVTYATLVERLKNQDSNGKHPVQNDSWRHHLYSFWTSKVAHQDVDAATKLDLSALEQDIPRLSQTPPFPALLRHFQRRLRDVRTAAQVEARLLDRATEAHFFAVEWARKRERARLARTAEGRERRRYLDLSTLNGDGLDYRWRQVKTLLQDLRSGLRARDAE